MKKLLSLGAFLLSLTLPVQTFACHLVSITETAAIDNGNGTFSYTFDICVGTENTFGFYLDFVGANLVSFPGTVTGPTTGNTISASVPASSGVGDIEYGDWDNNTATLFSNINQDCFTMTFVFDNVITDATVGGTQFDFNPPNGCDPLTIATTHCFTPSYIITINTDNFGIETTWNLINQASGAVVASGGPYADNSTIVENVCVPADCYDFEILDDFGDGMCCFEGIGSYSVLDNITSTVVASGGSFTFSETTPLPCAVLDIDLASFNVVAEDERRNLIEWTVTSQENNDAFLIERSEDLQYWTVIEELKGAGTTSEVIDYSVFDEDFNPVVNYYRLRQIDYNGEFTVFEPKSIDNRSNPTEVVSRTNYLGQQVDESYSGLVIEYFSDGTTKRVYQK